MMDNNGQICCWLLACRLLSCFCLTRYFCDRSVVLFVRARCKRLVRDRRSTASRPKNEKERREEGFTKSKYSPKHHGDPLINYIRQSEYHLLLFLYTTFQFLHTTFQFLHTTFDTTTFYIRFCTRLFNFCTRLFNFCTRLFNFCTRLFNFCTRLF